MWIIICRSTHWHLSEEVRHHFCRLAAHNPVFGSAMTMCGGVIRRPVAGQSGRIPVPCGHDCQITNFLPPRFLYQKWSSTTRMVFWNEAGWWVCRHIVVDWPVSVELYLLYENISCGFTSHVSRCNIGENGQPLQLCRAQCSGDEAHGVVELYVY